MFSGIELRLLTFVLAYIVLMAFVFPYARKIEKNPRKSPVYTEDARKKHGFDFTGVDFVYDEGKSRALRWFAWWMVVVILFAILSIFIQPHYIPALGDFSLADYVLYITVAIYVVAGIGACVMCGLRGKELFKKLGKGLVTLLPAVAMILIASGVRYIMEKGYVTTLYGRRRMLPELSSSNRNLRAQGERMALNTPIQGTAADIIKLAMVRVANRLEKEGLAARLILQVHDELIVECPESEAELAARLLKEEMEGAASLSVPLTADVNQGKNWLEAH